MPRDLTGGVAAEAAAEVKRPAIFAEILTAGAPVRLWSGIGDITFDANTYVGVGTFGAISSPEETTEIKATGLVFTLSGIPPALLATAISDVRQGMRARAWLAFVDETGAVVDAAVSIFEGLTAAVSTEDDAENCTLTLTAESYLARLKRPRPTRYTQEDQATRDPTDKGFAFIPSLQDRIIPWGKS